MEVDRGSGLSLSSIIGIFTHAPVLKIIGIMSELGKESE